MYNNVIKRKSFKKIRANGANRHIETSIKLQAFLIKNRMNKHIKELTIVSYKGIRDLHLRDLNCINILTGSNNGGKSSILELLYTLKNPTDISNWRIGTRVLPEMTRKRSYYSGYCNLFPVDVDNKEVRYAYESEDGSSHSVCLSLETGTTHKMISELHQTCGELSENVTNKDDAQVETHYLDISTEFDGKIESVDRIYDVQCGIEPEAEKQAYVNAIYVSSTNPILDGLNINQILQDTELHRVMIDMVKEFEPDILDIKPITNEDESSPMDYIILSESHGESLPLSAYGDGMKKALMLLNAVVHAKNGVLLLDDFETVIHVVAMNRVFSYVLETAMNLNVQVFLTSHSKEVIDRALGCSEELMPYISLLTLYKEGSKNYVRNLKASDAIAAYKDLGVELI